MVSVTLAMTSADRLEDIDFHLLWHLIINPLMPVPDAQDAIWLLPKTRRGITNNLGESAADLPGDGLEEAAGKLEQHFTIYEIVMDVFFHFPFKELSINQIVSSNYLADVPNYCRPNPRSNLK